MLQYTLFGGQVFVRGFVWLCHIYIYACSACAFLRLLAGILANSVLELVSRPSQPNLEQQLSNRYIIQLPSTSYHPPETLVNGVSLLEKATMQGFFRTYIYIHTRIHTCIHVCMRAYIHTCIHAYMHTCIHAYMHTCIHAYMHTYIHTYIHT